MVVIETYTHKIQINKNIYIFMKKQSENHDDFFLKIDLIKFFDIIKYIYYICVFF